MNHPDLKPVMFHFRDWTIFATDINGKTMYNAGKHTGGILNLRNLQLVYMSCKGDDMTESLEDLIQQINLFDQKEGINKMYRKD